MRSDGDRAMNEVQIYSDDLLLALQMRDVPGPCIAEALAEVRSHVAETGEDPLEAFGPSKAYADELVAALGNRDGPPPWWRGVLTWTAVASLLGGCFGGWQLVNGAIGVATDGRGALGLPAVVSLLVGIAVLVVGALLLIRMGLRSEVRVLDPLTGADMTPPLPRWVLPVMLIPLALILLAAVGAGISSR